MPYRTLVGRITLGFLLIALAMVPRPASADGIISDIIDYQLIGAPNPVQYLYDDILPNPEFQQVLNPITTVANPGIIGPREVWLMQPGPDLGVHPDPNPLDLSGISDIVAIVPVAGNKLELHFWSDDPTVTAAQFRQNLGLTAPPNQVPQIVEDGLGHDVNGLLFGAVPSPFQHLIVASDTLDRGLVPGGGVGGGIGISETFVFRAPGDHHIMNEGGHGAALWDAAGFPEWYNDVFTTALLNGTARNIAIEFTEGAHPDQADLLQDPITDIVTMRVDPGNVLVFGEWSEDPTKTSAAFLTGFFGAARYAIKGPYDETLPEGVPGSHLPLIDEFELRGKTAVDEIDFKSDPPAVPEPSTLVLLGTGLLVLGIAARRKFLS